MSEGKIMIDGRPAFYRHNNVNKLPEIVMLHGYSFTSKTWEDIGVMQEFAKHGKSVLAFDLPSYNQSADIDLWPDVWLKECMDKMNIQKPIIISPSMSSQYSIPYMIKNPTRISGLVAVAPIGLEKFVPAYPNVECPVLAIWGENDKEVPHAHGETFAATVKNGKYSVIKNSPHACYMSNTKEFFELTINFVNQCL